MNKERIIKALYAAKNVYCDPHHPLKGGAGFYQPIYLDHRNLLSFPGERALIIKELIKLLPKSNQFNIIAGNETAGIALAALMAEKIDKPLVYVRKTAKQGGTKKQIEGQINVGERVILVDDMMVTGGNIERAAHALNKSGAKIKKVLVISVVNDKMIRIKMKKLKINFNYLVDFQEIVTWGIENHKFTEIEIKTINDYLADPLNWGANSGYS